MCVLGSGFVFFFVVDWFAMVGFWGFLIHLCTTVVKGYCKSLEHFLCDDGSTNLDCTHTMLHKGTI